MFAGECLSEIMMFAGCRVKREYYLLVLLARVVILHT